MQAVAKDRILVVDDEPQVLVALEDLLSDRFTVLSTSSAEDALQVMGRDQDIAVVITDQRMPRMNGDELLSRLDRNSDAQRILITGFADLSAVIRAVNDGRIFAYVTKPWNADDLQLKVQTAVEHFRLARELALERERLQQQTRLLNSILDGMGEGVVAVASTGKVLLFNRRARQLLGPGLGSRLSNDWMKLCGVCHADGRSALPSDQDPLLRAMRGDPMPETEVLVHPAADTSARVAITSTVLMGDNGQLTGGIALLRDVTRQRSLEQQLNQSQKMEAIGRLAGGVAHDFNNMLAVIMGYGEMLLKRLGRDSSSHDDLVELITAAQRAAGLTRQLLAFSRHRMVQFTPLNLNEVVWGIEKMLGRIIGESVKVITKVTPKLGLVMGDAGQFEQMIVNLSVNARDAMPAGGTLTIETSNVTLDDAYTGAHPGVRSGPHVMLAVHDTGAGMDADTKRHIFEPFFTTKAVGQGTGLGLSTVYGVVQQSGGHIWVDSEIGRGSSFKLYFPRVQNVVAIPAREERGHAPATGTGTVLVVEDDPAVRRVAARILGDIGYTVLVADDAADARRICADRGRTIDVLLSDVMMPDIRGTELAKELAVTQPRMRVVYMSGYSGAAVVPDTQLDPGASYVQKPFSPGALAEKVREALETPA